MWVYKTHAQQQRGIRKANFPDSLEAANNSPGRGSSRMSSFFTDEEPSEKWCLQKHSFADCLHPCRVQVRGLRIWGGQRQWWVNESFLAILEVISNKATLTWAVERNLMVPVCFGSPGPEDVHIQRMTESRFSWPILACVSITLWEAANVSHTGLPPICEQAALCFLRYRPKVTFQSSKIHFKN